MPMISGGLAAFAGFMFAALRLQSAQKPNQPAIGVGALMLAVSAPDENGVDFDLSTRGELFDGSIKRMIICFGASRAGCSRRSTKI